MMEQGKDATSLTVDDLVNLAKEKYLKGRRARDIEIIVDNMKHYPESEGQWLYDLMNDLMPKSSSQRKGTASGDRPVPYGQWLLVAENNWESLNTHKNEFERSRDIRPPKFQFPQGITYRPVPKCTRKPGGAIIDVLIHYYVEGHLPFIQLPLDHDVDDLPPSYYPQFPVYSELGEIVYVYGPQGPQQQIKMTLLHYFLWRVLAVAIRPANFVLRQDRNSKWGYHSVIQNMADTFLPIKTAGKEDDEYVIPLASEFVGVVGAMWLDSPFYGEPKADHLKGLQEILAALHMFFTSRRASTCRDFIEFRRQTLQYDSREPQRFATRMFNFLRGHLRGAENSINQPTLIKNEMMNVWFEWIRPWKRCSEACRCAPCELDNEDYRRNYELFVEWNFTSYTVLFRDMLAMRTIFATETTSVSFFRDKTNKSHKAVMKMAKLAEIIGAEPMEAKFKHMMNSAKQNNDPMKRLLPLLQEFERAGCGTPGYKGEDRYALDEPYRPLFGDNVGFEVLPDLEHLYKQMDYLQRKIAPDLKALSRKHDANQSSAPQGGFFGWGSGSPAQTSSPKELKEHRALRDMDDMTKHVKEMLASTIWVDYKETLESFSLEAPKSTVQAANETADDTEESNLENRRSTLLRRLWLYPPQAYESAAIINLMSMLAKFLAQKYGNSDAPQWRKESKEAALAYVTYGTETTQTRGYLEGSGYVGKSRDVLRHELEGRNREESFYKASLEAPAGPKQMRRLLAEDDKVKTGVLGVRHLFAVYTDEDVGGDGCEYLVIKSRLGGEYLDHLKSQDLSGGDVSVSASMIQDANEQGLFKYRLEHTANGLTLRPANWYTEEAAPLGTDVYFNDTAELVQFYTEVPFFVERFVERGQSAGPRYGACLETDTTTYNATIFYLYLDKRPLASADGNGPATVWSVPELYRLRWLASYKMLWSMIGGMLGVYFAMVFGITRKVVLLLGIFYIFLNSLIEFMPHLQAKAFPKKKGL